MLFFPVADFTWPEWVPGLGGDYFLFFSPVFNIADSSIFLGVASILIFQKRFFKEKEVAESNPTSTIEPPASNFESQAIQPPTSNF